MKKIYIGTYEICGNLKNLAAGFRELGHEVFTAKKNHHAYYPTDEHDLHVDPQLTAGAQYGAVGDELRLLNVPKELEFYFDFDIYIFIAGETLFQRMADLPLLKQLGKTIIIFHAGSEVRHWLPMEPVYNSLGYEFPAFLRRDENTLANDPAQIFANTSAYTNTLANKLYTTRMSEAYADLVVSNPSFHGFGVRPYSAVIPPIDHASLRPNIPRRDIPVVVHAASNPSIKRTDLILDAVMRLQKEKVPFEFRLVSAMPNAQLMELLFEADVVVDRIACGSLGSFPNEAFGCGCAVAASNEATLNPLPLNRPAQALRPKTVYENLKRLLTDKDYRIDLAERGLAYAQLEYNTPKAAAQYLLSALERARNNDYDYYPFLWMEQVELPAGVGIPGFLRRKTWEIIARHGVRDPASVDRAADIGLIPPKHKGRANEVPVWDNTGFNDALTVCCGPNATYPYN